MANFDAGNLYEVNKTLVEKNEKPLKGKAFSNEYKKQITPYMEEKIHGHRYFMLLCNELKDYTVFNFHSGDCTKKMLENFETSFRSCLFNRGQVYCMEPTQDGVALEIWIRYDEDDEFHCYYLFPYDEAVIEL